MKIDGRAMALFNIKKEVYLVAILKLVAFWCSLFFIYNFVDFLFYSLCEESRSGAVLGFILKTVVGLVIYYGATTGDNYFSHKISKQVRNTLRKEIYNKVEKLSLNYTEAVNTGSLLVMNSSSIVNIEFYFNKFVPQMFATLFIVLSSFVIYGKIHILLFIAMLLLYPLIPVSIMIIIKKSKKANKKNFSDFLSLSEVFYDRLSGFTTAKIYGKEDNVAGDVDTRSAKYRKSTMALLRHQLEWVYSQLAYNLRSQERYEEALENYQKVIELGRKDTWLYSEIAWTYFLIKKPQLALDYMKKAKELSPVEVDLALITRTASILLALAEHKEAIKMIEEVISKEEYKNDINLLSNLAYIYIDMKDYNSALIYLQRLKELGRNDEWLNKNLILVYSKLEK